MIRAPMFALIILMLAAVPARGDDPRLVERLYDPNTVVRIEGRTKVQATITFGEGERIENVAVGDSEAWQITPNKRANLLFIKPLNPAARTNMTVITDRHTYLFDLVASPRAQPLYMLRFTYPEPAVVDDPAPQMVAGPNEVELAAASDPYAVVDPAELNFLWESDGKKEMLPLRVFDDGNATFLTWPAGTSVPAILIKDASGTEGPVNFTVREDTIVVDGVPREIVLRAGKESALLVNTGPVRPQPAGPEASLARSELLPTEDKN